jgi:hypothetical protein
LGGESHLYGDVLLLFGDGFEIHAVDQTEVHDVDGDLWIVTLAERGENVFLSKGHRV